MYVAYLTCASMLDPNGFPKISNGGLRHTNLGYSTSTPLIFMEVRWTFGSKWCFFFRRCWIDDTSDAFFTYSIYVYLRTVNLKKMNLEIMLSSHSRWGETGWRLSPGFRPWNLCPKIFLRSVRHLDPFWYMISLIFFANHENSWKFIDILNVVPCLFKKNANITFKVDSWYTYINASFEVQGRKIARDDSIGPQER